MTELTFLVNYPFKYVKASGECKNNRGRMLVVTVLENRVEMTVM